MENEVFSFFFSTKREKERQKGNGEKRWRRDIIRNKKI